MAEFKVGDVWTIRNRKTGETSETSIVLVDSDSVLFANGCAKTMQSLIVNNCIHFDFQRKEKING